MNAAAPVLEIEGVEHSFVALRVLKGVSLALAPGEIVGCVGPNGAGKTTLLSIAATLRRPTRGQVRVLGRDALREPAAVRPLLALMPERVGVYDDMRAREYLEFFADCYRLARELAAPRVEAWLADVGLDPCRLVGEMSKGMRQRLFFARTLLHAPALVLLDEPFSGMDPGAVEWTIERIRREAAQGRAFLVASHDLAELQRLSTRIVALRDGRVGSAASSSGRATYHLRLEGETAAELARVLAAFPAAATELRGRDELELRLESAPARDSDVLKRLLEAGVGVAGFAREGVAVDELYGKGARP